MNGQPCKWIIADGSCEFKDTDNAHCFMFDGNSEWIPNSQIKDIIYDDHNPDYPVAVLVTEWFIMKKGLEQYLKV